MSYLKIADGYLNDIASAIQKQLKLSEPMPVTEMAEKILSIPVNGNFRYIIAGTEKRIINDDCYKIRDYGFYKYSSLSFVNFSKVY